MREKSKERGEWGNGAALRNDELARGGLQVWKLRLICILERKNKVGCFFGQEAAGAATAGGTHAL